MGERGERTGIMQRIDRSRIENRDINELQRLSDDLLGYGHAFFATRDFSRIRISEGDSIEWRSWFRFRRPLRQQEKR